MKFSFWNEISFWYHQTENERRSELKIANRVSLRASGACVPDLARKPRESERLRLPDGVIMSMQYKLHSGTELIPE